MFFPYLGYVTQFQGIFEENLSGVAPLFIKHLDTLTAPRKELVQWMVKVELQQRKGNQHAKEEATIPLLAAYFKDDPDDLFRVLEVSNACFV